MWPPPSLPVQQGRGNVCCPVSSGHKGDPGQVKGEAQVGIREVAILLRVKHLQPGRQGGRHNAVAMQCCCLTQPTCLVDIPS
jgi:hypothetical protein